jgi:hypothetical protein
MPMLTEVARKIGVALGRISLQFTGEAPSRNGRYFRASNLGATEDQVSMEATVPERIDRHGTKVEDLAGTGIPDALGG